MELRTLNHRYQDLRLHLPTEIGELEEELDKRLRNLFKRGRIEVTVRLLGSTGQTVRLDRALAQRCLTELEELRAELGLLEPVSINLLATLPQVFVQDGQLDMQGALQALLVALGQAIEAADDMRQREGVALARDFELRLVTVERLTTRIRAMSEASSSETFLRLKDRLQRILGDDAKRLDENRLVHEVAMLADRADIDEELTRLASHVEQYRTIASEKGAVGRRLDFLLQEMAREATTIGSKVQDAEIQHLIVDLRGEISRMREQVQNIE